jgi:DNA-binding transcriptional regulator/RsmH inhibitor MraZ
MTQALYTHMNNKTIKKKKNNIGSFEDPSDCIKLWQMASWQEYIQERERDHMTRQEARELVGSNRTLL